MIIAHKYAALEFWFGREMRRMMARQGGQGKYNTYFCKIEIRMLAIRHSDFYRFSRRHKFNQHNNTQNLGACCVVCCSVFFDSRIQK